VGAVSLGLVRREDDELGEPEADAVGVVVEGVEGGVADEVVGVGLGGCCCRRLGRCSGGWTFRGGELSGEGPFLVSVGTQRERVNQLC
jgi:hypothetical protein